MPEHTNGCPAQVRIECHRSAFCSALFPRYCHVNMVIEHQTRLVGSECILEPLIFGSKLLSSSRCYAAAVAVVLVSRYTSYTSSWRVELNCSSNTAPSSKPGCSHCSGMV